MSKKQSFAALLLAISIYALSCANSGECNNTAAPLNPNGDSELALLMRAMFDDAMLMKEQLNQGKKPSPSIDFQKIFTAHATEPEKAASAEYQAFARTYVQVMQAFEAADHQKATKLYEAMVNNCTNCHQALCPGPLVRIAKLRN